MKGRISISKVHVSGEDIVIPGEKDYISIEIEDELSSIRFLSLKMSLLNFANAITGQGYLPVDFKLGGLKNVGKKLEVKTLEVHIPKKNPKRAFLSDEDIRQAIKISEVDGWKGRDKDAKNHHNYLPGDNYKINFHRWISVKNKT